jgi:hypothetical protein
MKLGYSEKQIGHMTYGKFYRLYEMYKNIFDLELSLTVNQQPYSSLEPKGIDDVVPF